MEVIRTVKKGKMLIRIGSCIVILIFVALIGASYYLYNYAIKRHQVAMNFDNLDYNAAITKAKEANPQIFNTEWYDQQGHDRWTITSDDGLKLTGYYIPAQLPSSKTVIMAHGYKSKAIDNLKYAKIFYEMGYNILMPDARGHGDSEGDYIGFGWPERKDYQLWIQKVIKTVGEDSQIALFGISMGGATVMMVSGEEIPDQVKVVIDDCGYTSVDEELSFQLKQIYKLPSFPLINTTSILTDLLCGYNFYEASAVKQVKKNKLPMLFIHGGDDNFVPTKMVYQVYEACQAEKDILIVEGAGHGMSYMIAPVLYKEKITEFVGRYIK